jgi:hypothetical protein
MTREEPSLETLWLQNIRTMDKVQIIERRNSSYCSGSKTITIPYTYQTLKIRVPVYKIIPVVLSSCEIGFLILREENRLNGNKTHRQISAPKKY